MGQSTIMCPLWINPGGGCGNTHVDFGLQPVAEDTCFQRAIGVLDIDGSYHISWVDPQKVPKTLVSTITDSCCVSPASIGPFQPNDLLAFGRKAWKKGLTCGLARTARLDYISSLIKTEPPITITKTQQTTCRYRAGFHSPRWNQDHLIFWRCF